jgi:hypothetical protein
LADGGGDITVINTTALAGLRTVALLASLLMGGMARQTIACGAYFGQRGPETGGQTATKIYNHSTRMVIARDGETSTITMEADYRGDARAFAVVIAVPTTLRRDQIRIADGALIQAMDRFTAPRLRETHDASPCPLPKGPAPAGLLGALMSGQSRGMAGADGEGTRGVTVEARYLVGEYDVAILSATQSDGLRAWLNDAGYQVPVAAEPVLAAYIQDGMKFFVARVNLAQKAALGYAMLRPLQIAYQSPKFVVPMRLSTINAEGPQEMFVFALTRRGRVESSNYATVPVPADAEVPPFVARNFSGFYDAVFDRMYQESGRAGVFVEFARSLRMAQGAAVGAGGPGISQVNQLGATWVTAEAGGDVVVTRLHARYDRARFTRDLMLLESDNTAPLAATFIVRHPYEGAAVCPEAAAYKAEVKARQKTEIDTLRRLTGWTDATMRALTGARSP